MLYTPIIIEEYAGIDRINEPVTVGIPFPKGLLRDSSKLSLIDPDDGPIPIQTQVLATWPDNSPKWILLDFQASVNACITKELELTLVDSEINFEHQNKIEIEEVEDFLKVNTGATTFYLNTNVFKPFERVTTDGNEILDDKNTKVVLTDDSGLEYTPVIDKIITETPGPLRTTLKVGGQFKLNELNKPNKPDKPIASFFSRISFFSNHSLIKMDFTILNPRAAKHPGGLWDLGDAGSIFFKDLSIHTTLKSDTKPPTIMYQLYEDPVPMDYQDYPKQTNPIDPTKPLAREIHDSDSEADFTGPKNLTIYQDSSGGENWQSLNHINRNGEVKNSFRGFRVYANNELIQDGLRANSIIEINNNEARISASIRYFWQNFPKSVEAKGNTLKTGLFPSLYDDVFELQGGEQKTHIFFLDFDRATKDKPGLDWCQFPLIPRTTPEWHAKSNVFNYMVPENNDSSKEFTALIHAAIKGDNTFFHRRETIDEYGWRNFGEFYADHEAVGHDGSESLISHYNNQYDGIYGTLIQFARSGDSRWFLLADQLCRHVKDIDIYHTDNDRPEFNRGMFWHTDHYIDAQTSTHRCFSKKHAEYRNMATHGGGPSLSHNYSSGFLLHHYMTGSPSSMEAVLELASFVLNNMDMVDTLSNRAIQGLRKTKFYLKNKIGKDKLVEPEKVYGLNGPGRASGNALNTLLDAYILTQDNRYLLRAEDLICRCICPDDDIEKRDLTDVENRWMYTVFLQALCRYLDVKTDENKFDRMWQYSRKSLTHYANWMKDNEYLYLEKPEKLEYPNETWAVQDIRKCNILLYASKYSTSKSDPAFLKKAEYFYHEALNYLYEFDTRSLTRPIALMMLYGMIYTHWKEQNADFKELSVPPNALDKPLHNSVFCYTSSLLPKRFAKVSLKKEWQFIKWKIIAKL